MLDSAPPGRNPSSADSRNWKRLLVAALVAGGWILGLVILAVMSANPVTLNQKQILHSEFVATATRLDAKSPTLIVDKEWIHGVELGKITVTNLEEAKMPAGREFLVPLQRLGKGRFQITPTTLPNEAPLIYPATPEAEAQLRAILKRSAD